MQSACTLSISWSPNTDRLTLSANRYIPYVHCACVCLLGLSIPRVQVGITYFLSLCAICYMCNVIHVFAFVHYGVNKLYMYNVYSFLNVWFQSYTGLLIGHLSFG